MKMSSFEADAAVEPGVGDIDGEVEDDEQSAINDNYAFEQEDVVVENGVDEKWPGTGDVEDGFHDDRTGEKVRGQGPEDFTELRIPIRTGEELGRNALLERLVDNIYDRNDYELKPGRFRVRGDVVDVMPAYMEHGLRVEICRFPWSKPLYLPWLFFRTPRYAVY